MKIVKLYSDFKGFKEVKFNLSGISLIRGVEKSNKKEDTYNGVGKTLIFYLIDYCLGTKTVATGLEKLKCNFYLDILINDKKFTLCRNSTNSDKHWIKDSDGNVLKEKGSKVKEFLQTECNILNEKNITFRSILGYFLRYKDSAFLKDIESNKKVQAYNSLLISAYLLNLNISYIINKKIYSDTIKKSVMMLKKLKDNEIKDILVNDSKDLKLALSEINNKLNNLYKKINEFKIADNFSELKLKFDDYNAELQKIINRIVIVKKRIEVIKDSLLEKVDVSIKDVIKLYANLQKIFSIELLNELAEVEKFHNNLLNNRKERFLYDLKILNTEYETLTNSKIQKEIEINSLYKILKSSGSLDEYNAINKEVLELEVKKSKIDNYLKALNITNEKILKTREQISINNTAANKYISKIDNYLEKSNLIFSQIVSELYGNDIVGQISVEINNGENNGLQFRISTKISNSDSSTGINHMKILSFGNVLLHQKVVNIKFLAHDDKIFHGTDAKQVASVLKYLFKNNEEKFQYIFAINQNTLNNLKDKYSNSDYESIIENNVILDLDGQGDSKKLLGAQIPIDLSE